MTELIRTMKVLRAAASTMPRLHEAVDPLSHPLLFALLPGPLRVSDLAATVHNDVSTVSRQASTLVEHGLITKVPDPDDGRAQLLALSAEGHALVRAARAARAEIFDDLLRDWNVTDINRFTTYLHDFAGEVTTHLLERVERSTP